MGWIGGENSTVEHIDKSLLPTLCSFYHLLGKLDEPFIYSGDQSNLVYECLADSGEESEDKKAG